MSSEEGIYDLGIFYMYLKSKKRKYKKKATRKSWVRTIFKKRKEKGVFHTLVQEMRLNDREF